MVNYRKNRIIIGDAENKIEYALSHMKCECCNVNYASAIHHHVKQQKKIFNERYTIELFDNYSSLCSSCHQIIEHNESQYNRELLGKVTSKPFDYWHNLKSGIDIYEFIDNYNRRDNE